MINYYLKEGDIMKKKEKEIMDVVFILDRSGSMSGLESDTIGGYNSYLKGMQNKNARITTVLFDDKYEMINNCTPIQDVKQLDNKIYFTRGSTALLDAIGKTIKYLDNINPKKVLFIITTDGYENSSREYTKNQIKKLIIEHSNWEFIYLGADIDSYSEASSIGIKSHRTSNFTKSKDGMKKVFANLMDLSSTYEEGNFINDSWKNGLEE